MKTTIKKKIEITLTLNKDEALWIKHIVQNQLQPGDESETDSKMRETLWNALPPMKELEGHDA